MSDQSTSEDMRDALKELVEAIDFYSEAWNRAMAGPPVPAELVITIRPLERLHESVEQARQLLGLPKPTPGQYDSELGVPGEQEEEALDPKWERLWQELSDLSEDIPVEEVEERWDQLIEEGYSLAAAHAALADNIEGSLEMIQQGRDSFRTMFE